MISQVFSRLWVNIRKLRLILETVGEVQIVNKNDYWYIDMGKDTLCDYHQVCQILNAFEFYNSSNKEMIVNFVELASLGVTAFAGFFPACSIR